MYSDSPFPSLGYAARRPFLCGDGLYKLPASNSIIRRRTKKVSHKGKVNEMNARCKAVPEGEGGLP